MPAPGAAAAGGASPKPGNGRRVTSRYSEESSISQRVSVSHDLTAPVLVLVFDSLKHDNIVSLDTDSGTSPAPYFMTIASVIPIGPSPAGQTGASAARTSHTTQPGDSTTRTKASKITSPTALYTPIQSSETSGLAPSGSLPPLSSETSSSPSPATATSTKDPPPNLGAHHRNIVLICVLGGVLGFVVCLLIGFCLLQACRCTESRKKPTKDRTLLPALSPLEKMDSNDPLVRMDDSVEIRAGSAIYVSSPLNAEDILRFNGPPTVPPRNPMREPGSQLPPNQPRAAVMYQYKPRASIKPPRKAPAPPLPRIHQPEQQIGRPQLGTDIFSSAIPSHHRSNSMANSAFEIEELAQEQQPSESQPALESFQGGSEVETEGRGPSIHHPALQYQSNLQTMRQSNSSSCYSNIVSDSIAPSYAQLRLSISRTSRSSFQNLIKPLSKLSGEPFLPTVIDEHEVQQQEEISQASEGGDQERNYSKETAAAISKQVTTYDSSNQEDSPEPWDVLSGEYSSFHFEDTISVQSAGDDSLQNDIN